MSRKWLAIVAKATISLLLIWYLVDRVDVGLVITRARTLDAGEALFGLVVLAAQTGLVTVRWWLVARTVGVALQLAATLRILLVGMFFNQTLPSSVGGDAVRVWLVTREGAPLGKAFNVVLCDRVIAVLVLIAVIGFSLPAIYARVGDEATRGALTVLVAIGAVALLVFLLVGERVARLLRRWKFTEPFANLAADFREIFRGAGSLAAITVLSAGIHILSVFVVYLLARGLDLHIAFVESLIVVPTVILLTTLPVSVAGWGVREGAMVAGFGFLGVPAEAALTLSVLFGLAQVAIALPGGLVWLAGRPRGVPPPSPDRMRG